MVMLNTTHLQPRNKQQPHEGNRQVRVSCFLSLSLSLVSHLTFGASFVVTRPIGKKIAATKGAQTILYVIKLLLLLQSSQNRYPAFQALCHL